MKIMDETENFVYDYWIDPSGRQEFLLYVSGNVPVAAAESYLVSCSNDSCSAYWQDGRIVVECPEGEICRIVVSSADGKFSDTVLVRNPYAGERTWKLFWLRAEERVLKLCDQKRFHERLVVCRLYTKIPQKLEAIFS